MFVVDECWLIATPLEGDTHVREGVCLGLAELINATTKERSFVHHSLSSFSADLKVQHDLPSFRSC